MSFPTPVPQVAQHNKKDGKPSCFPNFLECFRSSKDSFGNPGQDKKTELMSGPTLGEIPDPSTTLFTAPPSASQSLLPHPPISQAPSESSDNSGATSTTATPPDYTVGKSDGKSLGGSATFASSSVQSPGSPTIVTTTGVIASQSSFASGAIVTQASQSPSFTPEGSFSSTELSPSSPTATPAVSGAIRRVNAGAIAGGVLGALVFLIILVAVIMVRRRRRRYLAPSAEFLNSSFQHPPSFVDNPTAYPFGSTYATSHSPSYSSISHMTTMGHGFPVNAQNP